MIHAIKGPNFSGKSFYLQCYSGFPVDRVRQAIKAGRQLFRDNRNDLYIGAIPDYFFSGFFSTVESEIFRFQRTSSDIPSIFKEYLSYINLDELYPRNPFTLSGGEKAVISTLSYAISNPRSFCIDSTLEQLSVEWKTQLLNVLSGLSLPEIVLSDNRISELPTSLYTEMRYTPIAEQYSIKMELHDIITDNLNLPEEPERHTLEIRDLSFSYGKKNLFRNLNLQLETGKIYHLKGPNGAGKSTLSKILSGILKPSKKGKIFFDGKEVSPYSNPGKIVGYTFQQPDEQLFSKTVREEMGLCGKPYTRSAYHESLAESFGLNPLLDLHPFELPVSMRKRLSIASALSVERPFYILDEPTLYLDDNNMYALKIILDKLVIAGKGVVLISHSKRFVSFFNTIQTLELN